MSVCYDFLGFLATIVFAKYKTPKGYEMPHILRTVVQDATAYFLIIFASHLVYELSLLSPIPILKLLPGGGNDIYIPIMMGRLLLSVRKAAESSNTRCSLTSMGRTSVAMQFPPMHSEGGMLRIEEDVPLSSLASTMPIPESGSPQSATPVG